ncbi:MAG TPA: glycosyltransferase family 2 protein [Candidatus Woesebacteria bacterium]|nr:glycosyltransferase family 2 protein [Candidatus Woesebacteria bacterium]
MNSLSIVLLNYNSTDETIECIESLEKTNSKRVACSVIVVDNHSTEDHVKKLERFLEIHTKKSQFSFEFIRNSSNRGYTGGNNTGIKKALDKGSDYVLILNNDTTVSPDFINPLVAVLESDKNAGIVVPKIYFYPGQEYHADRYTKKDHGNVIWYAGGKLDWSNVLGSHRGVDEVDEDKYTKTEETDYATGACIMLRASTLRKVGMFDEKYFLYYEDSDLSMRIKKAGLKILFVPQSTIWHKNAGSTGGSGSKLQDYYLTRNRLLFGFRYAPIRAKVALLREAARHYLHGREWQKKGVQDFFFQRFGKGTYPVSE